MLPRWSKTRFEESAIALPMAPISTQRFHTRLPKRPSTPTCGVVCGSQQTGSYPRQVTSRGLSPRLPSTSAGSAHETCAISMIRTKFQSPLRIRSLKRYSTVEKLHTSAELDPGNNQGERWFDKAAVLSHSKSP